MTTALAYALIGGFLPTLVWLWFWLREDKLHPEPRRLLMITFLLGMVAVPVAVPLERIVSAWTSSLPLIFIGWAFIEELLKYIAAYAGGMHTRAENEPVDAMIYLITAALGFVAAENSLFILEPFMVGDVFTGLVTMNVRFVGTTLLHIVASSAIGASIAFSFYKKEKVRIEHFLFGLVSAVALHAIFNFFILDAGPRGMFVVFSLIWTSVIGLLFVFERVKRVRR